MPSPASKNLVPEAKISLLWTTKKQIFLMVLQIIGINSSSGTTGKEATVSSPQTYSNMKASQELFKASGISFSNHSRYFV